LNWLLRKITHGLTAVTKSLVAFGPLGLFGVALLDSALVPLPGGPDAVMILLSTAKPAWMPLYAIAGTLGSVIGCLILYNISLRAGRRALKRFAPEKQERVKLLLERYDVLSILVGSVLPPPFPFKLFVIMAGVLDINALRFAFAIGVGRAFRFFLEGYLAVRYGERAGELLKQYYPSIGIGVAVLIILGFVLKNLLRRKPRVVENRG
jgi:membrane protein YqaA with SNARE-associated domain